MQLLIACGTWIREQDKTVIDYIHSCDIFPNVAMICDATRLPDFMVASTLDMLKQQEGILIGIKLLFADENSYLSTDQYTRSDYLIAELLKSYDKCPDVAIFREDNRFYDRDGNIHYRFTEEEVLHAMKLL